MAVVIGLTGSIATGKSTVSNMLRDMGLPIVDADVISREVVEPGEVAYQKIVEAFGKEILFDDQTIDRKKLGSIVFASEEKRQTLNDIVHPEVRRKMIDQREHYIQEGYNGIVLDIPLLFESKLTSFVDKTVVVYVDENTQLERLMDRDESTKEEAQQRIQAQISVEEKANMADAVINNNGSLTDTRNQVTNLLREWGIPEKHTS